MCQTWLLIYLPDLFTYFNFKSPKPQFKFTKKTRLMDPN